MTQIAGFGFVVAVAVVVAAVAVEIFAIGATKATRL